MNLSISLLFLLRSSPPPPPLHPTPSSVPASAEASAERPPTFHYLLFTNNWLCPGNEARPGRGGRRGWPTGIRAGGRPRLSSLTPCCGPRLASAGASAQPAGEEAAAGSQQPAPPGSGRQPSAHPALTAAVPCPRLGHGSRETAHPLSRPFRATCSPQSRRARPLRGASGDGFQGGAAPPPSPKCSVFLCSVRVKRRSLSHRPARFSRRLLSYPRPRSPDPPLPARPGPAAAASRARPGPAALFGETRGCPGSRPRPPPTSLPLAQAQRASPGCGVRGSSAHPTSRWHPARPGPFLGHLCPMDNTRTTPKCSSAKGQALSQAPGFPPGAHTPGAAASQVPAANCSCVDAERQLLALEGPLVRIHQRAVPAGSERVPAHRAAAWRRKVPSGLLREKGAKLDCRRPEGPSCSGTWPQVAVTLGWGALPGR